MSNLLSQASLVMIPSGYKEDVVYSQIPTNGNGDLSFTRASNGTRINSAGLVEVCPWNFVEQSSNLGSWSTAGVTITTGITDAYGTTNAVTMSNISSGSNTDYIAEFSNPMDLPGGTVINTSVYLKGSGTIGVAIERGNTGDYFFTSQIFTLTNAWVRYDFAYTMPSGTRNGIHFYVTNLTGTTATSVDICFPQINYGSTAKPYFPTTDRLNVPRLTYQNGGGGCPSLLLEPQRTNIFPNSQTTANWSFTNMSRTANYGISPDGTQNADLLSPTTSGSVTFQSDITTSSLVIGQPFVVSFFIKLNASFTSDAGTNILDIRLSGPTVWSRPTVRVNLETGEVTSINNAIYISSTNFGNGWFRITFGATPTGTSGQVALQSPTSVTMNGGSFYIWGLQGEANATYATSYIPSQASSATRVADACSKTGISSLIGQTEGVLFVDFEFKGYDELAKWIAFLGTGGTYIGLYTDNVFKIVAEVANATSQFISQSFTFSVGQRYKLALAYKANDFAFYVNGTQIATDSSGTVPTTSQFDFNYNTTANNLSSRIYNQVALFPTRLTNAELASITSL
jgi:hypothetical protein